MDSLEKLLDALKSQDPAERQHATAALWNHWYEEAGDEAVERLNEGVRYMNTEKLPQAEKVFTELTKRYPDYGEGHNKLATVLFLRGEYRQSIKECEIALKLIPHHFGAWNGLGMCQYHLGMFNEAINSFKHALEIQPFATANRTFIAKCLGKLN